MCFKLITKGQSMSSELIDSFAYITPTPGHLFIDIKLVESAGRVVGKVMSTNKEDNILRYGAHVLVDTQPDDVIDFWFKGKQYHRIKYDYIIAILHKGEE